MTGSPVAGLVRGWVRLYTGGLPAELRDARRDEIDDDLWCEHAEAAAAGRSARALDADLCLRLLFGIPSDISWRLAYRRAPTPSSLERSSSMSSRTVGVLAIVAVASLVAQLILSTLIGEQAFFSWGGSVILLVAWIVSFPVSVVGLAWLVHDRVGPLGRLGVLAVTVGVFTMFAGFIVPVFVGSAMLTWDLARIGVISRIFPIVHVATVVLAIVGVPGGFGGALLILYLASWIAIGMSLIRGVPVPRTMTA